MLDIRDDDLKRAVNAGRKALECLHEARRELGGAGGWGVIDILGGGMITKLIKHSKIDSAAFLIEESKRCLEGFCTELEVLARSYGSDFGISEFAVFVDYFLGGSIGEFYMQSRIVTAKRQVDEAIMRVEDVLNKLYQY